jgi:hypothetical protein
MIYLMNSALTYDKEKEKENSRAHTTFCIYGQSRLMINSEISKSETFHLAPTVVRGTEAQ